MRLRTVVLLAVALGLPGRARADADSDRIARLADLGKVWGTVKVLHPYLGYKDIDWDAALIAAIPKVKAATSAEELRAAVQGMLKALGDPTTRVRATDDTPKLPDLPAAEAWTATGGVGVLSVRSLPARSDPQARKKLDELKKSIGEAKAVVVDLRASDPDDFWPFYLFGSLDDELASRPVRAPARRVRFWSGFPPQRGGTSGGYRQGMLEVAGDAFTPATTRPKPRRVVFVLNGAVPSIVRALQDTGEGLVVAHGEQPPDGNVREVKLHGGGVALIRRAEVGGGELVVDATVPAADDPIPLARKLALTPPKKRGAKVAFPPPITRTESDYADMKAPGYEYRLLALYRFWNTIHDFYPYLDLIGDWDAVLPEFVPRFEQATTAKAYAEVVAELVTRVPDGHSFARGNPDLPWEGRLPAPVSVRVVEGRPVVVKLADPTAPAGVAVGDVVVDVDGEPAAARLQRLKKLVAGSTEAYRDQATASRLLDGPADHPVEVTFEDARGQRKKVKLAHDMKFWEAKEEGKPYRLLSPEIGYADLTRLEVAEVDAMFEAFHDTKAIVLDMRGYPRATAWAIAPRINVKGARYGAQFRRRVQEGSEDDDEGGSSAAFSQPLPKTDKPLYRGVTVMLIDDRAISQSEHSGLFFEAAAGTTFVGTPTAGANGDVTRFVLPGGIVVSFTGHDVRHADGRQLQRVGLEPHVRVEPTLAGIRAGRDEVLERGVQVAKEKMGR